MEAKIAQFTKASFIVPHLLQAAALAIHVDTLKGLASAGKVDCLIWDSSSLFRSRVGIFTFPT